MIAAWLAEEIAGNYIMDKKACNKQPPCAPYVFYYRKPITLAHEERTILALFIQYIFFTFLKTGKENGYGTKKILSDIVNQTGLGWGYDKNPRLKTLCYCFVNVFPSFIHFLRDRGALVNVAF